MLRSMVFIDYQNFNIAMKSYLQGLSEKHFNVNYYNLAQNLNDKVILNPILLKTFLFAYKPCKQLLELDFYNNYYNWLSGLKSKDYFEVIEGIQEIRPVNKQTKIDIKNSETYTTVEKGTDINLAVHMLSKAYQNSYDVAILVSGDTDYIPIIEILHQIGKIVILAVLPTQNIDKYKDYKDAHISMGLDFLKNSVTKNTPKT